jgi:Flp pilus assembly protein TadB
MRPRRTHIHWAWVPAAIFSAVVGWIRFGAVVTLLAVVGGLAVALYAEWRARRRRRSDG